jgi:hypothetical protein
LRSPTSVLAGALSTTPSFSRGEVGQVEVDSDPSSVSQAQRFEIVDPRLCVIDGIDHALWWVSTWDAILDLWGADQCISLWVSGSRHIDAGVG